MPVAKISRRQSGQAAVEAAIVMPLMVLMVLGILQLTVAQNARIMTEYAAYNAARAGIVWNGNNERMHDAALMSLLPTLGRTDSLAETAKTWAFATASDRALRSLPWPKPKETPAALDPSDLLGLVRVDTVNPSSLAPLDTLWKLRGGHDWKELDFDGPDSYPEVPNLDQKFARFFNPQLPDDQEELYRRATVLQIRVRYWYELRIPFANWMVFLCWYASHAGANLHSSHQKGFETASLPEMQVLWGLASAEKRYFIPLSATYSMRMQSNFHRKWIMHDQPDWGL